MTLQRQSGTFELTLSLFAVIVVLLAVTVWVLIPEAKRYLRLEEEVQSSVQKTVRLQTQYDGLYAQKETTEADAAALSEQFENSADAASLLSWIKTVWADTGVTVEGNNGVFGIKAETKTPASFYRFVDRLDAAPWLLSADLPVGMRAENGRITVTFTLRSASAAAPTPLQK